MPKKLQEAIAETDGLSAAGLVEESLVLTHKVAQESFIFRLMHKSDYRISNDSLDKTDGDQHSRIDETVPYLRQPNQRPKTGLSSRGNLPCPLSSSASKPCEVLRV
jgi:hypothetical protein